MLPSPTVISFLNGDTWRDFNFYLIQISGSLEPEVLANHNTAGEWKVTLEFARGLFELLVLLPVKAAAEKQYCAIMFAPPQPLNSIAIFPHSETIEDDRQQQQQQGIIIGCFIIVTPFPRP